MNARSRRTVLRTLFASGAFAAAAAAIVPVVADARGTAAPSRDGTSDGRAPGPAHDVLFDETYRGRHIHVRRQRDADGHGDSHDHGHGHGHGGTGGHTDAAPGPMSGAHTGAPGVEVLIDGRPLRLMRRADGSYLSMVDHYGSHPTVLAAARGAVDGLGMARLAREHITR